jgi:ribose/xylose/arabinose/galactoside ABC-type transport system permease subunit
MVLIVGIICGLFNGLLIAVFRISPMIATMGSQYIIRGLCYILTGAKTILFTNPALEYIGRGKILGIPNSIIIMILVFLILSYVLNKTKFGRSVYAVGSNERSAYLSGISPVKVKMMAYVIAAVSSTLAGIITVSQVGAAVPSSGVGSEMEIIAAVYLGGVAATGGKGNLIGTFLGIFVICAINNGLTLIGVQSYWQTFMRGVVILAAVYMDTLRTQRTKSA